MTAKKGGLGRGLGRGLDAMISDTAKPRSADKAQEKPLHQETNPKDKVFMVKLSQVEPNRKQPRKQFDEDALLELAESIKQFGVLQPLLVQKKDDYYEIIAGERRWRASKLAGVKEIPVIVKIAERVAKSRTAVTNSMRLLKLDERVQQMLIDEMLTTGHARALLSIENKELQYSTAVKVFDEKLSVRETEKLVKEVLNPAKKEKPQEKDRAQDLIYEQLEEKIKGIIGSKVAIHRKTKDKGKIEISYFSQEELERIVELLETIR